MARAIGSYPIGRGFDPPSRYQYAIYSNDYNSSFFINDKLHSWYDKDDKYIDVVNEMYNDNVLEDDDIEELDLSKEKDDFER